MQFQTKLSPQQFAWFMSENKPITKEVIAIEIKVNYDSKITICYKIMISSNDVTTLDESQCFATKKELLDSL